MKKHMLFALLLALALCASACMNEGRETTPSPSPGASVTPDVIPGITPMPTDAAGAQGAEAAGSAAGNALESAGEAAGSAVEAAGEAAGGVVEGLGEMIEGFVDGKQLTESEAPEAVEAIRSKYPDAKITGITMRTHENKQVYHIMLEGAADTTEVYVDAMGNVMPYVSGEEVKVS